MPGAFRNFFGGLYDRATPGVVNYDRQTGKTMNNGVGMAQILARIGLTIAGQPALGAVAARGIGAVANRIQQSDPSPEAVGQSPSLNVSLPGYSVSQPQISNLGLGAQSPGNAWAGYMQSPGSVNNFGNTQFGNGAASVPGAWNPSSAWGQAVASNKPASQGSVAGFGNNVGGFITGNPSSAGAFSDSASKSKGLGWTTIYQRGA